MSKQANKTMIGIFVVAALVLVITGIMIFGSGKFLKERHTFVMFFDTSVKGLDIGAPITLQGVKIGTIKDIVLRGNYEDKTFDIPVYVEIEPDRITPTGKKPQKRNTEKNMQLLIERGMRAQLKTQSMVTGKLFIELDFHPDKTINLKGKDINFPEIPTIQTSLDELAEKIEKVPIEEIFEKLHSAVAGIEKVINSPELMSVVQNLDKTLVNTRKLLQNIDKQVKPLAKSAELTLSDARMFVHKVGNQIDPLSSSLSETIEAAESALKHAKITLSTIEGSIGYDSKVMYELSRTLDEISSAAQSVSLLADYLERHPESLLRGKGGQK